MPEKRLPMRTVTCQNAGLLWQTCSVIHSGHCLASQEGTGCLPPSPTSSLPNSAHPTQVTHLMSCVGYDGDGEGGVTEHLSLERAPNPRDTQETLSLALTVNHSFCLGYNADLKSKQKHSPDSRGKAGAKNMQKGSCLCSPLQEAKLWGVLNAEDREGAGNMLHSL